MDSKTHYDLIIIGGGAAGFFTAIQTAELSYSTAKILILEKSSQILQKVKISGGGRCNVTHSCFEPKALTQHYPRGEKFLISPFHRFQASDMVTWLAQQGVELKTEADGRMFPTSNHSQTIIDCLTQAAQEHKVDLKIKKEVSSIKTEGGEFNIECSDDSFYSCDHLMVATGGTRLKSSEKLPIQLDHPILSPVPSLFSFNISDSLIQDLAGISQPHVQCQIIDTKLKTSGPIIITHWGLSGPAILKLSALAARELAENDYQFKITINWTPHDNLTQRFNAQRTQNGKKLIIKNSPLPNIPKRLWASFVKKTTIMEDTSWSQLSKTQESELINALRHCILSVTGKSINKDEFVTCGGVSLQQINPKNFSSKIHPNLYFAGEVLDIDGITGGFNFQNAWTSSHLAAQDISAKILTH